jgi:glutamyl-tRNA synthetase
VVDDHEMGVTHIIRGDEHLRNAFRQIPIYEAMGWTVPKFAHIPLIHGADGAKLSKRHGALSTLEYRTMGYLPEAVNAYLLRLGWGHGDQDIFTEDEAIAVFDIKGINKGPSRLDFDKLNAVNQHFMRLADDDRLFALTKPLLDAESPLSPALASTVRRALPIVKQRAHTLPELAAAFAFLRTVRPVVLSPQARKALTPETVARLAGLRPALEGLAAWTPADISGAIQSYCTAQGLGMGQIGPALRAALTGGLPAPDLAPVMDWLGRAETLGRIDDQLASAQA